MSRPIKYSTAVIAKEKNYDEGVWNCFKDNGKLIDYSRNINPYKNDGKFYSAPTQSKLQKWLREKHNFHPYIVPVGLLPIDGVEKWKIANIRDLTLKTEEDLGGILLRRRRNEENYFDTYEDALEEALKQMLELIK